MGSKPLDVGVVLGGDALRVRINGILHLSVSREYLVAVQSWESGIPGTSWVIEFTLKDGAVVKSEYSRRDIWEAILKGVEVALHA